MTKVSSQNSKAHQKELKNLIKEQKNEIEKLKINHTRNKNLVKNEHDKDIVALQTLNNQNKVNHIARQEKILQELQDNLDRVKKNTNKEINQIRKSNENKIVNENALFEQDYRNLKSKNALKTQETQETNNESLRRIKKSFEQQKADLKREGLRDLSTDKNVSQNKKRINQNEYSRQRTSESRKFNKALTELKRNNTSILQNNREKLDEDLNLQETTQKKDIENLKIQNNEKKISEIKSFESYFQKIKNNNEQDLQKMLKNKEVLIHDLEEQLKTKSDLAIERKDEKFYSMDTIKFKVKELANNKGYQVDIPVNSEEAKNIDFKAEKRQLRLSMQRSHKFKTENDGRTDSINRKETYMSKVPVENIIDPKKIEKSYSEGVLSFKIGLA